MELVVHGEGARFDVLGKANLIDTVGEVDAGVGPIENAEAL